jgi:hypothetical protein
MSYVIVMTSSRTIQPSNTITGRIVHKESGISLPDLLVVIYDLDPNTRPEKVFDSSGSNNDASIPLTNMSPAVRLSSVLSSGDDMSGRGSGHFNLQFDDSEYRIQNPAEKRSDLLLMVIGPEDSDSHTTILFRSKYLRQNSGRIESYFLTITTDQLKKTGILPSCQEDVSTVYKSSNYITQSNSKLSLNKGISCYKKNMIKNHLTEKQNFRNIFKHKIMTKTNTYQGSTMKYAVVAKFGK